VINLENVDRSRNFGALRIEIPLLPFTGRMAVFVQHKILRSRDENLRKYNNLEKQVEEEWLKTEVGLIGERSYSPPSFLNTGTK